MVLMALGRGGYDIGDIVLHPLILEKKVAKLNVSLGNQHCPFAPWRPTEGKVFDFFAFDTETTAIDDERPYLTPNYVLGAACNGQMGLFVSRDNLLPFFQAHWGVPFILHNAAFDLKVAGVLLQPHIDIYEAVDHNHVWDTQVLQRLYSLATAGHTARGESGLADCAAAYLGVELEKGQEDGKGNKVRTNFGQFLNKPPSTIPTQYLTYLGQDALATWHMFWELHRRIKKMLQEAHTVWGFVDDVWLRDAIRRFGPLTHHIQLRASILMDVLGANGIGIDQARREEKVRQVQALMEECRERMQQHCFLVDQPGSSKVLQSLLTEFQRDNPDLELKRTESGEQWSTAEEDLTHLVSKDGFFRDYVIFKAAEKLLSTYLVKMGQPRLHPKFGYLLETGRTYCGGGFNIQNLPKELDEKSPGSTVRGCFVPGEGNVFIDCDYSQIELVVLGYVMEKQFGLCSRLARLINDNCDVHRLIAATVVGKDLAEVTKAERDSAKAVSFGRPGGMGVKGLRRAAQISYGIDLSDEEVQQRIQAYHQLCPELDWFLQDEVDAGEVISSTLHLTPAQYYQAVGQCFDAADLKNQGPSGWLGGMLLKVLRDQTPTTKKGMGRPYTPAEIDFFWDLARHLPVKLKPKLQARLDNRQADKNLWAAVHNWASLRAVFTVTGRLRANATFTSSRNNVFQGVAADGAILGLWLVWRAGYKLVDFVHDQLIVESPADDTVLERALAIKALMIEGMLQVVPGMNVKVETVCTQSLNKADLDPRYKVSRKDLDEGTSCHLWAQDSFPL